MDIMTIGEVLIDLTQTGINAQGIPEYTANPGGAPANLCVAASRLGASTGFIGKVGKDAFGSLLIRTLTDDNVNTEGLIVDRAYPTTLAVVSVDEKGERDFSFYRKPGADVMLDISEISPELLKNNKIFHFGSVSLTDEPAASATLTAAQTAKKNGSIISYDPNYRERLWTSEAEAIEKMKAPLDMVDIIKVSDEELPLLTGTSELEKGSLILANYGIKLIVVTLGADGVFFRRGNETGSLTGIKVKVGDTNGAGDSFFGALLSRLCKLDKPLEIGREELISALDFANHAAALTASRHGAIPALPTLTEVEEFMES